MPIFTVRGAIEPAALGFTSMHEHLLINGALTSGHKGTQKRVTMDQLGTIRWNVPGSPDNLVVDDASMIVQGLQLYREAGGTGVVDMTNVGLGRRVDALVEIAARSDVHVMVGCGWYVATTHPDYVATSEIDFLANKLIQELRLGVGDTGIRPALIGEVGTSADIDPNEYKVLAASALAAIETGSSINVHLDPLGYKAIDVVQFLTNFGVAPGRIILSHLDEALDLAYHLEVAAAGANLEFDTFGQESYWKYPHRDPTDEQRFEHLAELLGRGLDHQIVLGCDVYTKSCHTAFGGMGYEHLPGRVADSLQSRYGVSETQLDQMTIHNPRVLLDRPMQTGT